MRTIDQNSVSNVSFLAALARNGRLLLRLASMVLDYWTVGTRVRRSYRDRESKGDMYWLDEQGSA